MNLNNFSSETSVHNSYLSVSTILNSLDAIVYVADIETHEMIFMNKLAIENFGNHKGAPCYSILQKGQDKPCDFCTNHLLVNDNNEPEKVHVWEFQNTINNNWYECRDQAIRWIDGRLVRMEIAIDITNRKKMETNLKLAKQKAENLASIDHLTQVRNRRSFFTDAKKMINSNEGFTSFIMIDVDYFKKINDTYGHIIGDKVLKSITVLIEKNIRKEDIFGRLGGEEFAILLPNIDLEIALKIADSLRKKIYEHNITIDDIIINVSCSFGVATLNEADIDEIYSNADNALYAAKNNGRNRVETYTI